VPLVSSLPGEMKKWYLLIVDCREERQEGSLGHPPELISLLQKTMLRPPSVSCAKSMTVSGRALWGAFLILFLLAVFAPSLSAFEEKGCEDVGFAQRAPSQYSQNALKQRLERDPADVDALIHLGIYEQEHGHSSTAAALFDRAISAKPNCSLGYYFAGLIHDGLSNVERSRSEADIRKALTLNPGLRSDGNIQGYMSSHPHLWAVRPVAPVIEEPWRLSRILATANHFLIGLGLGLFMATLIYYIARRGKPGERPS